jgi:hypothetical protein
MHRAWTATLDQMMTESPAAPLGRLEGAYRVAEARPGSNLPHHAMDDEQGAVRSHPQSRSNVTPRATLADAPPTRTGSAGDVYAGLLHGTDPSDPARAPNLSGSRGRGKGGESHPPRAADRLKIKISQRADQQLGLDPI